MMTEAPGNQVFPKLSEGPAKMSEAPGNQAFPQLPEETRNDD